MAASLIGDLEFMNVLLSEALDGRLDIRYSNHVHAKRPVSLVVDCKSVYDTTLSPSSTGDVDDRRVAIDLLQLREGLARTSGRLRWAPTTRMLADVLTKNKGDPADLVRACMRTSRYILSDEDTIFKWRADEKA